MCTYTCFAQIVNGITHSITVQAHNFLDHASGVILKRKEIVFTQIVLELTTKIGRLDDFELDYMDPSI